MKRKYWLIVFLVLLVAFLTIHTEIKKKDFVEIDDFKIPKDDYKTIIQVAEENDFDSILLVNIKTKEYLSLKNFRGVGPPGKYEF